LRKSPALWESIRQWSEAGADLHDRCLVTLRDPAIPAPPPGGADDPATAGLRVLVFGHDTAGEMAELVAPGGLGRPGWSRGFRGGVRHRFRNRGAPAGPSPIRSVMLRDGRGLRIMARDAAGRFAATNAPAPGLVACTDEGLAAVPCDASATCGGTCPDGSHCGGLPALGVPCTCIAASQPCGDTEPVCNGTCPAGESCVNVGGVPYPDCACLPTGSTGCGTVYPTCGDGDCPAGTTCSVTTFTCCGGGEHLGRLLLRTVRLVARRRSCT